MARYRVISHALRIASALLGLPPLAAAATADTTNGDSGYGFVGAPFVKYAPETAWAGGVVGLYYFRLNTDPGGSSRPSSVSGGATYTQKKQISTGVDYDFYFNGDVYHWSGGFDYKKIPFEFYGIGNDNPKDPIDHYTPLWIGGDAEFTRNFERTAEGEGLNAGLAVEVRHDKILASDPGGSIASGSVPGARGGLSSGGGFVAMYDTRDNIFSTHAGTYLKIKAMFYGVAIGSSFSFDRLDVDARDFFPAFGSHTIALQGLLELVRGTEPFYSMAQLGGDVNMRGYFQGRFRDNDMAVIQGEYRLPLFWRFALAGFAAAGEVAGTTDQFRMSALKYTVGAGIRFLVIQGERLGVRLDYGSGWDSSEVYFSILEAF
ncbi:MAG TPA: BamA/TamA family outer membrane protein [Bacteroidota bacterium]|nr:BamA/TamA family outer membrane protein [Bacteroidota bacterium]